MVPQVLFFAKIFGHVVLLEQGGLFVGSGFQKLFVWLKQGQGLIANADGSKVALPPRENRAAGEAKQSRRAHPPPPPPIREKIGKNYDKQKADKNK
jgi:hypothetical protein